MRHGAPTWAGLAIALGAILVLAGPAFLLWQWLKPEPFDRDHLLIRFESVRYESAGLVFAYRIENRTGRSARLLGHATTIRLKQDADRPPVGYPTLALPFEIAPHSMKIIEV